MNFSKFFARQDVRQVSSLYVAMILNVFFGVGVSIVNTRFLGPQVYGEFKLLSSLFLLMSTLTAFGYYSSVGRLVAQNKHESIKKNLFGGSLLVSLCISLLIAALLGIFSFFIDDFFNADLSWALRVCLPLLLVFPIRLCLENIFQGDNRIGELSFLRILPQLLYLIVAFVLGLFFGLSLISALLLQLGLMLVVVGFLTIRLNPRVENFRSSLCLLNSEVKAYGFQVYLGSLANVGAVQVFSILIGYFVDLKSVGFYSLALTVCAPLTLIASVFGTTFFKKFANSESIPGKVLIASALSSFVVFVVFVCLVDKLIIFLYSEDYTPSIQLAYILCSGFLIHGFGDIYNRFLGAHGKGREIRTGAALAGVVAVVAGLFLTTQYGVTGAAVAKTLSSLTYFLMMFWFYIKRDCPNF